ncbi:MAG: hypothetical protein HYZ83_08280 [Candidatus Omnitrophica bacterium]|nr:hypothetical protein [Candidatus Omnitrophota bacterium]
MRKECHCPTGAIPILWNKIDKGDCEEARRADEAISKPGLLRSLRSLAMTGNGLACAVCFGDPNSLQSKGVMWGIFVLLGVVGFVLGAILWTAIAWNYRSKHLSNASARAQK